MRETLTVCFFLGAGSLIPAMASGAAPGPAEKPEANREIAGSAGEHDWPQWRGQRRDGVSRETGLLQDWPKDGPPLAWKVEGLGGGYSAPSVAAGRIFGTSLRGGDDVVWALSEEDGSTLWVTRIGPASRQRMPQGREGPGCTPTVDGELLYVLGLSGDLACLQVRDGKIVWQRSLTRDFGGRVPTWSFRESPLVDGDRVIATPGGEDAVIVALEKRTGEEIWRSAAVEGSGGGARAAGGPDRRGREGGREAAGAPSPPPVVLVPAGSRWKYLDSGAFPGPDWTKVDFEDDAWAEGPAQLGYGDGDEATRIDGAPEKYPTYYFRRKFQVEDPSRLRPLVARLVRDDGAIVYLNGREVVRDNMPEGPVDRGTYARDAGLDENEFHGHDVPAGVLVPGANVIAVEVHQANATSSDVSFDLELREKIPGADVAGAPPAGRRPGFGGGFGGSGAAYASAVAIDFEGERQYVQFTATGLVGVAASDGRFLWRYDRPANTHRIQCSTPVYHEGLVFASSAYDAGGGLVKLTKDGDGRVKAEEVYFSEDLRNHHGGVVLFEGCLYGADGGNEGGYLVCLDFKTGKVLWSEEERGKRRAPKGSVALADRRLYYRTETGTMLLVEPNPKEYLERGRFEQPHRSRQPAWAHPVVANGRLYLRDQDVLLSYDVKAK